MDNFNHPNMITEYQRFCSAFARRHGLDLESLKSCFIEDVPGMKQGWEKWKSGIKARSSETSIVA